ncbi:MAG: PASTA domain-containing protein [Candidatus Hydrogenedentes bacterium]|nr:PASTA domain-containing protein [Candidatus Hydrogenedentota bacterium]
MSSSLFGLGFVWWCLRWFFAGLFFIGIMAGSGYYVFSEAVQGANCVTVPDITNMPVQEAARVLTANGLEMGTQTARASDKWQPDYVMYQTPAAGKVVRSGRKVYPTVSRTEFASAPDLHGKTLQEAIAELDRSQYQQGQISRVADQAPANTVISQDPPPGQPVPENSKINLLVSSGPGQGQQLYMPNLIGMTSQDAIKTLKPLGVEAIPVQVDRPDAPANVVIDQRPGTGTLITPGTRVYFDIRSDTPIEGAWRDVTVSYTVPQSWMQREVRIDVITKDGARQTIFPPQAQYVDGKPPVLDPGSKVNQKIRFRDEIMVEVFLDGVKARSYHYVGDAEPEIVDFEDTSGGNT